MKKILILFVFCGAQIECMASKNIVSLLMRLKAPINNVKSVLLSESALSGVPEDKKKLIKKEAERYSKGRAEDFKRYSPQFFAWQMLADDENSERIIQAGAQILCINIKSKNMPIDVCRTILGSLLSVEMHYGLTSRDKRQAQVFEDHAADVCDALEWMSDVSMHVGNYRIQFQ